MGFTPFPDHLLSTELESLVPQSQSVSLFDESACGFASVSQWDEEALRQVYHTHFVAASEALNLDVHAEKVHTFQRPYACVQMAEQYNRQWRAQRGLPPSRLLFVHEINGGIKERVWTPFLRDDVPGVASCQLMQSAWRDFIEKGEYLPSFLFWLVNYMIGWDCDLLVQPSNTTATWTTEYDVVLTMSGFKKSNPFSYMDEHDGWHHPWLKRHYQALKHHSPVIFDVPHEPHWDCSGSHFPADAPYCAVTIDNYACLNQPTEYLSMNTTIEHHPPRTLSAFLSYHYDAYTLYDTFHTDTPARSVMFSASGTSVNDAAVELSKWLKEQGFTIESRVAKLKPDVDRPRHMKKYDELQLYAQQKYCILSALDRQSAGQLVVEMSTVGTLVFTTSPKLFHRLLQHPYLYSHSYADIQHKIEFLEAHPHLHEQLLAYTKHRLRFVDLSTLPSPRQIIQRSQSALHQAHATNKRSYSGELFIPPEQRAAVWSRCRRRC